MALTVSESFSVQSPNGNSLAIFIEAQSGEIKLKDVNGKVEDLTDYISGSPYRYNSVDPLGIAIEPILGGNIANGQRATITGGQSNTATGTNSGVSFGAGNTASAFNSVVSGGVFNTASAQSSTVGGGASNIASNDTSTIAGGYGNLASNFGSTVGGGDYNSAAGARATIGGGCCNTASSSYSSIVGGKCNNTSTFADAMIVGSCITADRACATFVNNLSIKNIPTSSAGLPSGSIWSSSGVLCIVP